MYKLIRDNIPQIMAEKNIPLDFAVAQGSDFFNKLLFEKLVEETNEFLQATSKENAISELVDMMEVIYYLLEIYNVSIEDLSKLMDEKRATKGGFKNRYIGFFPDNK